MLDSENYYDYELSVNSYNISVFAAKTWTIHNTNRAIDSGKVRKSPGPDTVTNEHQRKFDAENRRAEQL